MLNYTQHSFLKLFSPQYKNLHTAESLREKTKFVKTLNAFRVLHNSLYKYAYRGWYEPMQKGNAMSVAILALYGVIKLEGRQARIMGFAATFSITYLAFLYRKLGLMYDASVKLRRAWLHAPQTPKWMRKWIKAVPDFRVDVGNFYFVQKTTVVNVLDCIFTTTISFLLAY